jgi:flagellar assembly protein FliH
MFDAVPARLSLMSVSERRSGFAPLQTAKQQSAHNTTGADDYARGLADGQAVAEAAFELERAQYRALIANADAVAPDSGAEVASLIVETILLLVEQLVGKTAVDADFLNEQVATALALITEADDARSVVVHPDDAALIGPCVNNLPVRSDASLARGTVRIICSEGWVEHGVPLGLEKLRAQLRTENQA